MECCVICTEEKGDLPLTRRSILTAGNPNARGPSVLGPDPYGPLQAATCAAVRDGDPKECDGQSEQEGACEALSRALTKNTVSSRPKTHLAAAPPTPYISRIGLRNCRKQQY